MGRSDKGDVPGPDRHGVCRQPGRRGRFERYYPVDKRCGQAMASSSVKLTSLRIGDFVLRYRAVIGGVLLIISAIMAYYCTRVTIATKFDDFFPASHTTVQLYEQWHRYG